MNAVTLKLIVVIAAALLFGVGQRRALGGSATWAMNPSSGDWNTAANWMPRTIPNGSSDTATFGPSAVTDLSINTTAVTVDSIVYETASAPFTITVDSSNGVVNLFLTGAGIINNSGIVQSLDTGPNAALFFSNIATAGQMTSFGGPGGFFVFSNSASAASASFDIVSDEINQANLVFGIPRRQQMLQLQSVTMHLSASLHPQRLLVR